MSLDIPATAKKYARDLLDKMTEKRCAHLSDLEEAFTRAITEAAPKTNPWGYPTPYRLADYYDAVAKNKADALEKMVNPPAVASKYGKWNNSVFPPPPASEDDGA